MRGETPAKVDALLRIVGRLPPEHQARFALLVELLSTAPPAASDQVQRLIWSAIAVSRVSRRDCLLRIDSAIEYLSQQRVLDRSVSPRHIPQQHRTRARP